MKRIRIVILALSALVSVLACYGCSKGPSQAGLMRPDEPRLEPTIPYGMRAIAIRVDGVIGFVAPGNYVDVIKTADQRSSMLLENVRVLNGRHNPRIVTLLVTPEEARKVAGVGKGVRLALATRSPGRNKTTQDAVSVVPL
jgi:Flp pilus assembly protein CpaB